jgi:putative membrane protein
MFNDTMNGITQAHYMNGGWEGVGHHGFGFMHGPFSILLFIVFIVLAVALFRRVFRGKGMCGHGGSSNALTTLSERFAKGEIEEEEFRAKRDVLKSRK